jgi:hypothetical protein
MDVRLDQLHGRALGRRGRTMPHSQCLQEARVVALPNHFTVTSATYSRRRGGRGPHRCFGA